MPIIQYFLCFFLLLLASVITICGFYLSARGEEKKHADGSMTRHGNILKFWYFFWDRKKENKYITYSGDEFLLVAERIKPYLKRFNVIHTINYKTCTIKVDLFDDNTLYFIAIIAKEVRVRFRLHTNIEKNCSTEYLLFVEEINEVYVFPEWLRKMMAHCITCHASFWGSIVFWSFHLLCKQAFLRDFFYELTDHYWPMVICTWISYMLSFAFVATFFYKKL